MVYQHQHYCYLLITNKSNKPQILFIDATGANTTYICRNDQEILTLKTKMHIKALIFGSFGLIVLYIQNPKTVFLERTSF